MSAIFDKKRMQYSKRTTLRINVANITLNIFFMFHAFLLYFSKRTMGATCPHLLLIVFQLHDMFFCNMGNLSLKS